MLDTMSPARLTPLAGNNFIEAAKFIFKISFNSFCFVLNQEAENFCKRLRNNLAVVIGQT